MKNLNEALNNANMTYNQLVEIADNIIRDSVAPCNDIIAEASANIESMSNDYIRDLMLRLSLRTFSFSEIKDKSALTAFCAEALRKESYAKSFNTADGSVAVRENIAILNTSEETLVEAIYDLCSSLLRTKLDECHRVVDVLKTILMSRLSEAKLNAVPDAQI